MKLRWFKAKNSPRLLLQILIKKEWVGIPVEFEDPSERPGFLKMVAQAKTAIFHKKKSVKPLPPVENIGNC